LLAIAVGSICAGGIWVGQGLGYIPGSFMTGSRFWAVAGAVCVVAGFGLALYAARRGGT
jgi:hypothetical protein